jgi:hypothetical protein
VDVTIAVPIVKDRGGRGRQPCSVVRGERSIVGEAAQLSRPFAGHGNRGAVDVDVRVVVEKLAPEVEANAVLAARLRKLPSVMGAAGGSKKNVRLRLGQIRADEPTDRLLIPRTSFSNRE